jgi:hypothetical protein
MIIEIAGDQRLHRARASGNQHDVGGEAVLREQAAVARDPEKSLAGIDRDVREREFSPPPSRAQAKQKQQRAIADDCTLDEYLRGASVSTHGIRRLTTA